MTRVAIVSPSSRLRASLAAALRASPAFDVVAVAASDSNLPLSAEVVVVAHAMEDSLTPVQPTRDNAVGTVLTNREREILALLADGLANKQIAARLGISKNTVKTHLELLFDKLGVSSRAEAV
ncbi:MAG TPA: helix-turn-helix transcriptional regulator, partial [Gemmatimonadaceae bacterium]|nr:helix-turn-helix transcriptional regulator [Gemmatimonadaceae bacterium]